MRIQQITLFKPSPAEFVKKGILAKGFKGMSLERKTKRAKQGISGVTAALLTAATLSSAQVAAEISQLPLHTTQAAAPNILFILDTSGSMDREYLPDGHSFDGIFQMKSVHTNPLYYNPAVTYFPWINADGTTMPNASSTAARIDLATSWAGETDLTTGTHAEYFHFTAAVDNDISQPNNYDRIRIRPNDAPFTGHGREQRTDCTGGTCTYAQEIQNFANWYQYYRTRMLSAKAAIGRAFFDLPSNYRVGFGSINVAHVEIDGVIGDAITQGVRPFTIDIKTELFDKLYESRSTGATTPLRRSLVGAGRYFSRTDERGPWSSTPGELGGEDLACRRNYTILMSDGAENDPHFSSSIGNVDSTDVPTITGSNGETYTYVATSPFSDENQNSLGDIAMYYWKRDLRPDLENNLSSTPRNPAFWQHMVTHSVGYGLTGTIDPVLAFEAITDDTIIINWPTIPPFYNPSDSANVFATSRVDDFLHAGVNSRGGSFSTNDPFTFGLELQTAFRAISVEASASAAAAVSNGTRLETESRIYQARFKPKDWSGELLAFEINVDDGSIGSQLWNAADSITETGRQIFTYSNGTGAAFTAAGISAEQMAMLNLNPDTLNNDGKGTERLAYLRGDQSNEMANGGSFKDRDSLLGDIVNSEPAFMAKQDFGFAALPPSAGGGIAYRNFVANKPDGVLFVGANDGMLHAFDSDTGDELFAYVPNGVFSNLHLLTSQSYTDSHRYFVDGSPRVVDAFIGGSWKTILLGSTGAGGKTIFALDVTDPTNFGASNVLWEFEHENLGYTMSQPSIIRLEDGTWAAAFGNGYDSDNQQAQLYMLNLATGNQLPGSPMNTFVGDANNKNGLSDIVPVDTTGDRITDAIYAGDLLGNLWKFEPSDTGSNWQVAEFENGSPTPLFQASDISGQVQPITSRPLVGRNPNGGVMVYFGTGKFFEVGDNILPNDPQVQTFYGIRDNGSNVAGRVNLQQQTILQEGLTSESVAFDYRLISNTPVEYTSKQGWYLDLISPGETTGNGERVTGQALLRQGRVVFISNVPSDDPCMVGGYSWLMELDAINGGRTNHAVFDVNDDGVIDDADILAIMHPDSDASEGHATGRRINDLVTTPTILESGETEFKFMSGASGRIIVVEEISGVNPIGRQSWEQKR